VSGAVAQSAVGLLFVVSGIAKLLDPSAAAEVLGVARVPERLRSPAVRALSALELGLATWLLAGGGTPAVVVALGFLAGFTAVLVYLARVAPSASCGCMGSISSGSHGVAIVRNACLALLLVVAGVEGGTPGALEVIVGAQVALLLLLATEGGGVLARLREFTGNQRRAPST
jgi:Methylamine utilisation protein MauE